MATLNDIPEYLRERDLSDWNPGRGLLKGSLATFAASVVLGGLWCAVAWMVPILTTHWLLLSAQAFLITWLLFAAMHRYAGMAGIGCTVVVVIHALGLTIIKFLVAREALADLPVVPGGWRFSADYFLIGSAPALGAIAGAGFLCHDGDGAANELAELLMTNPFTGRHP